MSNRLFCAVFLGVAVATASSASLAEAASSAAAYTVSVGPSITIGGGNTHVTSFCYGVDGRPGTFQVIPFAAKLPPGDYASINTAGSHFLCVGDDGKPGRVARVVVNQGVLSKSDSTIGL